MSVLPLFLLLKLLLCLLFAHHCLSLTRKTNSSTLRTTDFLKRKLLIFIASPLDLHLARGGGEELRSPWIDDEKAEVGEDNRACVQGLTAVLGRSITLLGSDLEK